MKRILLILLTVCLCAAAAAQNPRAVIKSIYNGDTAEQVQSKYDRAVGSNPADEPAMLLMEVVYLHHAGRSVDAYYYYCAHREAIEQSADVAKTLKSLQLRLADIFGNVESDSLKEILSIDKESEYDRYIEVAEANGSNGLDVLNNAREARAYQDVLSDRSVDGCDRYLAKYVSAPSDHRKGILDHKADLVYATVSRSSDEDVIDSFLQTYPDYPRASQLAGRLADLRYARVTREGTVDALKWFMELYPTHSGASRIHGLLSDLEYRSLDKSNLEAVVAYLAAYPSSSHKAELQDIVDYATMMETADLGRIFKYIGTHGYDSRYPAMVRAIARVHDAFILTPDIREVDLVRFRDSDGNVGYWDKSGKVAIPARYDAMAVSGGYFPYDAVFGPEFLAGRGCAVVGQNGKYGVIGTGGSLLLPMRSDEIAITDCIETRPSGNGGELEKYSFSGAFMGSDTTRVPEGVAPCLKRGSFNRGAGWTGLAGCLNANANVCLEGENYGKLITRGGIMMDLRATNLGNGSSAFNDRMVSTEKGMVDVTGWNVTGQDQYSMHEYVKEDMILVCRDGRYGYLDGSMKQAIPMEYSYAESFCGGTALVRGRNGYIIMDKSGSPVFSADFIARLDIGSRLRRELDHYALYVFREEGEYGIVDSAGMVVLEPVKVDPDRAKGPEDVRMSISDQGFIEYYRDGRLHRLDLTEVLSRTQE